MKVIRDMAYQNPCAQRQKLDLYLPDSETFNVLIYFHGGGLESGDKSEPMENLNLLLEHGIALVRANYRMYPDANYPAFIEDAAAAVAWVKTHITAYGTCENIYVGGSSAGAYLAMMLCFDEQYLGAHGLNPADVAGYLFDAGQPTTHFNVLNERGLDPRQIVVDEAAPLYHVGEPNGRPPVFITVAENDMPGRFEQIQLLCQTLSQFGWPDERVLYRFLPGHMHCDYLCDAVFAEMILEFIAEIKML